MANEIKRSCIDCGTINCSVCNKSYPKFCLTTENKDEVILNEALVTTLVVKDRVLGHNPAAALYTSNSYYKWLLEEDK